MARHTAKYLYGPNCDPRHWTNTPYKNVLEVKIKLANKNIRRLVQGELTDPVSINIKACTDAISFNRGLLQELKDEM